MPEEMFVPQFSLMVGGQEAPPELMRAIVEFMVDDSLYLPDMFTLRLHDPALEWVDSELLAVGVEIEIVATAASHGTQSGASDQLIKGEITALEPNFERDGEPSLIVRGYDRAHRLHRGKKSRSFLSATDSEIAQKIARELKMQVEVDPTRVVHDYVFQDNQTNLEFLQTRAQRIGYEVYVEDKTLHFRQREATQEPGPELVWGENLRDFRPRLTTMTQVDEVIVRGWDPKTKREIISRVSEGKISPDVGLGESGGELTRQAFGVAAQAVVVNRPVNSLDEANALAQALCDEISGDFIQAEGACFGDPRVQAGRIVTISGVGTRFGGQYFVTSATHIYNEDGYETLFNISGRQPDTLLNLLNSAHDGGQNWGIAIGIVTNNKDPEGLGRVKVKFPWLSENETSTWARLAMPMAGQDKGFYCLPEINDEVLVAFEHGDIDHPYVLGALWNGRDKPPKRNDQVIGRDGKVNRRILRSRSGHEIILDDSSGQEKIVIRDKTGRNQIVIDAGQKKLSLECDGDIVLKGRNVTIEGTAGVDVKGRTINLN
jgi:phage protein D/phage baseplate assembly protein gpV